MITRSDPRNAHFLATQNALDAKIALLQRQISSGYRVENPSDDPSAVRDILQLRTSALHTDQVVSNLRYVKAEVDNAESTLQEAVKMLDRIRLLGVQGANATSDQTTTLPILAADVGSLQQRMVALANSQTGGRFSFGGDADQTAPYAFDPLAAGGVTPLTSATSSRRIEDPAGGTFLVSLTAADIFDVRNPDTSPAAGNVFSAINDLRVALGAGDSSGIQSSLDKLRAAGEHLNTQLAFYGRAQNQVNTALESGLRALTRTKSDLSSLQDTDLTAAIVELKDTQTQRDVSLQSKGQIRRNSLFDYL